MLTPSTPTTAGSMTAAIAAINAQRALAVDGVNAAFDAAIAALSERPVRDFVLPTIEQCQDESRTKNGKNLTPDGIEMLYRLFDDGAGYNRAAKAMLINPTAARNRKALWTKEGGLNRERQPLQGIDA